MTAVEREVAVVDDVAELVERFPHEYARWGAARGPGRGLVSDRAAVWWADSGWRGPWLQGFGDTRPHADRD